MRRTPPIELGGSWGSFGLHAEGGAVRVRADARAYDALGVQLAWRTGAADKAACDIERRDRTPDPAMARLGAHPDFWRFWVLSEVAAKLLDLPVLDWLRSYRSGRVPRQASTARALVIPCWDGTWALAFGRIPAGPAGLQEAAGDIDAWGFTAGHVVVRTVPGPTLERISADILEARWSGTQSWG